MNKYWCGPCKYIVRVSDGDGEVVGCVLVVDDADGADCGLVAGGGVQVEAGLEVAGVEPGVGVFDPEGVVDGGDEGGGGGAVGDCDGSEVFVVLRGDALFDFADAGLTGQGIGGDDLVTLFDVLDFLVATISHEDLRVRQEAVASGVGCHLLWTQGPCAGEKCVHGVFDLRERHGCFEEVSCRACVGVNARVHEEGVECAQHSLELDHAHPVICAGIKAVVAALVAFSVQVVVEGLSEVREVGGGVGDDDVRVDLGRSLGRGGIGC